MIRVHQLVLSWKITSWCKQIQLVVQTGARYWWSETCNALYIMLAAVNVEASVTSGRKKIHIFVTFLRWWSDMVFVFFVCKGLEDIQSCVSLFINKHLYSLRLSDKNERELIQGPSKVSTNLHLCQQSAILFWCRAGGVSSTFPWWGMLLK